MCAKQLGVDKLVSKISKGLMSELSIARLLLDNLLSFHIVEFHVKKKKKRQERRRPTEIASRTQKMKYCPIMLSPYGLNALPRRICEQVQSWPQPGPYVAVPQPVALKVKPFRLTLGASATRLGVGAISAIGRDDFASHQEDFSGKGSFLLSITTWVSELGVGTQSSGIWRISAIPELSLSKFLLFQTQVRNCFVTFKRPVPAERGGREDGRAEVDLYQLQRRQLFV